MLDWIKLFDLESFSVKTCTWKMDRRMGAFYGFMQLTATTLSAIHRTRGVVRRQLLLSSKAC